MNPIQHMGRAGVFPESQVKSVIFLMAYLKKPKPFLAEKEM